MPVWVSIFLVSLLVTFGGVIGALISAWAQEQMVAIRKLQFDSSEETKARIMANEELKSLKARTDAIESEQRNLKRMIMERKPANP